ncbi:glycosyltransferase family 4 protein [Homoserinibacter sp. YIM 151385]|uniref:glycosyltransferase family 4 protein n=1 Tax=Homoserinibacter sp. YIM 151385 TaxID=2985506 RepID=UPI0022F033AA|nr:glycosyltransferase family 1 protein [Homoserinibacter sp. YIM 151385]WBU37754.1 glycosyltransferase family 1 protein [Homoserinibacter sp. YIM 151385]
MTTLRVIIDQMISPVPGGVGRYAEELTRALIDTAPGDAVVEGFVSASPEPDYERIARRLPGLGALHKSALARRELSAAWQLGFTALPGRGFIHAMSPLAPLARHDRVENPDTQVAVTIHDVVPWTHPETLTPRGVSWHKSMIRRAHRYADAVVVPTHAVAAELDELLGFGDRIRVIGGAVGTALVLPEDPEARAAELDLPERYLLAVGTLEPRKGLEPLIRALGTGAAGELPLLVVGPAGWGDVDVASVAEDAGLPEGRVRALGRLDDEDLALVMSRAEVFVFPSLAEGFGLPVLEAMHFGVPVIHSDAPAVAEVAADAGLAVALEPGEGYPGRLAAAIRGVLEDDALRARLGVQGRDRARAFSWRDSAERVWQLHAEL